MVLSFDRWVGKVAVVTGASSGIGAAIAEKLVKNGVIVAAVDIREELLQELAKKLSEQKGKLYPIKVDVSKEEDILKAFKWIKENLGPIHILVNCAGMPDFTNDLTSGDTKAWEKLLQVNVIGLSTCTREAVKDMQANKVDGQIIHMNSVVGHKVPNFPGLNFGVYPASKHAITALTETLRLELNQQKSKIKITSVSPGAVRTEFGLTSYPKAILENMKKYLASVVVLNAEDVADAVYYILSTPPHVQIHELTIKPINEEI